MTVVTMQTLSVSKEAFSLVSTSIMATVGMDIKVYKAQSSSKWRILSGEIVIGECGSTLYVADATSLHHCLKNKQQKLIWFLW